MLDTSGTDRYDEHVKSGLITVLDESFRQEPDFLRLLQSPNLPKQERCSVIDAGFQGKLHSYVLNFLKLLTEKGYIARFADCCSAYRAQYNEDKGILEVSAVAAISLTDGQKERLAEKLTAITGKQIDLICKVDPAVLGGIRLNFDGKQVDGTVKGRLDAMAKTLHDTVL